MIDAYNAYQPYLANVPSETEFNNQKSEILKILLLSLSLSLTSSFSLF